MPQKLDATKVYLFIEVAASAFFAMMFVSMSLYEVTVAGLTPLQLVLVGTTVELSVFIFEVPTGIVADVYSRRLSIIIGYLLMGVGFLVEGSFESGLPVCSTSQFGGVICLKSGSFGDRSSLARLIEFLRHEPAASEKNDG